ncbi:filamentous hemagglutinin N-terminal domain-containing protein, partial [Acinetobacter sp. ANC 4636]
LSNTGTVNAARIAIDSDSLRNQGTIEQTGTQALDLNVGALSNQGGQIGLISNTAGSGTGSGTGSSGTTQPVTPNNPAQDGGSVTVVDNTSTVPKTYAAG